MNKKEMSELFSLMMTNGNWANAKMFCGGESALDYTISFWTQCLSDIDFWTGQHTVVQLVRECVYPPTIAEFRKKADDVISSYDAEIEAALQDIKMMTMFYGSVEEAYQKLPQGRIKSTIKAMGGPAMMEIPMANGSERWNIEGFRSTYWTLLKRQLVLTPQKKVLLERKSS